MRIYKKVVNTADMSTLDWLKYRQKLGIGGSEMAAILGYNKWTDIVDVWVNKTAKTVEVTEDNEYMYWGRKLEDMLASEFEIRTGKKVRRNNYILQSVKYPWLFANIDRELVGVDEGLEIKTTSEYKTKEWEGDNVPTAYYIQCQHYMAVTGFKRWWIAVLIGGNNFKYKCIERNEGDINLIIESGREFWKMVEDNVMPAVTGSENSTKALQGIYKETKDETKELPLEANTYVEKYEEAKANKYKWAEEETLAKNQLCALLGHAENGIAGTYRISWKPTKGRSSFDTKKFRKDHPDLADKYTKVSEGTRRFTIKNMK